MTKPKTQLAKGTRLPVLWVLNILVDKFRFFHIIVVKNRLDPNLLQHLNPSAHAYLKSESTI